MVVTAKRNSTFIALDPGAVELEPFGDPTELGLLGSPKGLVGGTTHGHCFEPVFSGDNGIALHDPMRTICPGDFVGFAYRDDNGEMQNLMKQYVGYDGGHIFARTPTTCMKIPLDRMQHCWRVAFMSRSKRLAWFMYKLDRPSAGDARMARLAKRFDEHYRTAAQRAKPGPERREDVARRHFDAIGGFDAGLAILATVLAIVAIFVPAFGPYITILSALLAAFATGPALTLGAVAILLNVINIVFLSPALWLIVSEPGTGAMLMSAMGLLFLAPQVLAAGAIKRSRRSKCAG